MHTDAPENYLQILRDVPEERLLPEERTRLEADRVSAATNLLHVELSNALLQQGLMNVAIDVDGRPALKVVTARFERGITFLYLGGDDFIVVAEGSEDSVTEGKVSIHFWWSLQGFRASMGGHPLGPLVHVFREVIARNPVA